MVDDSIWDSTDIGTGLSAGERERLFKLLKRYPEVFPTQVGGSAFVMLHIFNLFSLYSFIV